jgi:hypothetical protein
MAVLYKGFAYKDWLTANYDEQRSLWCVKASISQQAA